MAMPPGALGADLSQLALGMEGREPFHLGRSLRDYQAVDGMRLRLDRVAAWSASRRPMVVGQERATQPAASSAPAPATGGVVVRWRRESFGPDQE
jgi:hypothetical protein